MFRSAFATIVALGLGWGLWTFSEALEERIVPPALFPLFRLALIFAGLGLADRVFAFFNANFFGSKR